jgi:phospholipase C
LRKKDLELIRGLLSRRRALQGIGAVLGATAAGCASDDPASADGTGSSESSSSGPAPTTTTLTPSTSSSADTSSSSSEGSSSSSESSSSEESSTGEPVDECIGDGGLSPEELLADIDTIVVVVMENRSFDHYFGSASFLESWQIEGLAGAESNLDLSGTAVSVFAMSNQEIDDPPHDWTPVHLAWNLGKMDGFVIQHELDHPATHTEVMGYYVRDQLPISYALAEGYTLCDHWHAAVLGPTWPNRFYIHCASSDGEMGNFPHGSLTSIWDVLSAEGIEGRNYYSDIAWVWGAFANPFTSYTAGLDEFFAAAQGGSLPPFVVIDPNFGLLGGGGQNDDHPDANITMGQVFLASVYEALAQSPQWYSCLLVITYDEHGGFYDHVNPPETVDDLPEFAQLGIRVPSIVIGPHVRRGCVNSTQLEHCSIISTVTVKHGLTPMNDRVAASSDLSSCINPAYLGDPQPPVKLPPIEAALEDLLVQRPPHPDTHKELRQMIADGTIPIPANRRHPEAGRDIAMELIGHAQRLGVLKLTKK